MHFHFLALFLSYVAMVSAETQHAATTVVVFVTVPPSTSAASTPIIQPAATTDLQHSEAETTVPSLDITTTTSLSSSHSTQQVHQATSTEDFAQVTSAPSTQTDYFEPGASSLGGGQVDTAGGASGSDAAAFHLSKGGLAAILIVVILAVLFGIASTVLFIVAKRRQWTMRQTLTRASRRLTGRFGQPKTPRTAAVADRQSRRTGIRMASPPRPGVKAVYPPGHKRGLVVDVQDPEKGPQPLQVRAPKNTRPRENTWIQRLWGDSWK